MKKLLRLSMALVLILSLAACAKEPTAEELYNLVNEKSSAMEKMDSTISMTGKISVGVQGLSQDIDFDMSGAVKGENIGKEGMKMAMPMEIEMMGITMETNMYFADGWYLMEMMDQKLKCPMDIDMALDQFSNVEIQPLEYITLGEMTKDDNTKLYTMPYTMDMDKAIEMSSEAFNMTGIDPADMDNIEWQDSTGVIVTDKDGLIKSQDASIAFSASVEGIDMTCEMDITITYNDIANDFSVEIPDAGEYTEVPAAELGLETA